MNKPKPIEEKKAVFNVRLTPAMLAKVAKRGGSRWVRSLIEEALKAQK